MSAASALTSSSSTVGAYRIPPLTGTRIAVLRAPGGEDLAAAASPDRELDGVDGVADLDLIQEALRIVRERGRLVEVQVDRLEEARTTRVRHRHGSTPRREFSHAG